MTEYQQLLKETSILLSSIFSKDLMQIAQDIIDDDESWGMDEAAEMDLFKKPQDVAEFVIGCMGNHIYDIGDEHRRAGNFGLYEIFYDASNAWMAESHRKLSKV